MTILELLKAHSIAAFAGCDTLCACDRKWRTNIAWRAHLAEVLETHQQEQHAVLLEQLADELPTLPNHPDEWPWLLRGRAERIREWL